MAEQWFRLAADATFYARGMDDALALLGAHFFTHAWGLYDHTAVKELFVSGEVKITVEPHAEPSEPPWVEEGNAACEGAERATAKQLFRLVANATFYADDMQDALALLGAHFTRFYGREDLEPGEKPFFESGEAKITLEGKSDEEGSHSDDGGELNLEAV